MLPSKTPFVPTATVPATTHIIFFERAPPIKAMRTFAAWTRVPEIWKIQADELEISQTHRKKNGRDVLSAAPPAIVMSVEMVTPVVHLYRPGERIEPPMRPRRRNT
jgi:hypothetical protein